MSGESAGLEVVAAEGLACWIDLAAAPDHAGFPTFATHNIAHHEHLVMLGTAIQRAEWILAEVTGQPQWPLVTGRLRLVAGWADTIAFRASDPDLDLVLGRHPQKRVSLSKEQAVGELSCRTLAEMAESCRDLRVDTPAADKAAAVAGMDKADKTARAAVSSPS